MKKCLSLGEIDRFQIIIQIIPITIIILDNLLYYNSTFNNDFYDHAFVIMVSQSLGKSLSFIPFIISIIRNRNSKKKYQNVNNKLAKFPLIFLTSIVTFVINLVFYIAIEEYQIDILIFDIILLSTLAYLLMNIKFYRHQYLSIVMILIIGIIKNFINFSGGEIYWIKLLMSLLTEIFFCVNIILYKYIMEYQFCSPFELCFYDGIFSLILSIIGYAIATNKELSNHGQYYVEYNDKYYLDNFYEYFEKLSDIQQVMVFVYETLYHLIIFLFPLIVIKKYTIFHYLIILTFDDDGSFYFIENVENIKKSLYNMVCLLCIIFMHLIFNELIEVNCCQFQINTRKNITQRAIEDVFPIREKEGNPSLYSLESLIVDDGYSVNIDE